jgi:DNA/RNA-binding protein KIN17
MNATRWVTLTEFIKHLGRSGMAHVDETEKGWFIAWIDNSPKALAKQEASLKKDRMTMSDEQRERLLIAEQIERAKEEQAEAGPSSLDEEIAAEDKQLKREDGQEKVTLSFSMKAPAPVQVATAPAPIKFNAFKAAAKPVAGNALKRPNPLKSNGPLSGIEQEAKRRKMESDT